MHPRLEVLQKIDALQDNHCNSCEVPSLGRNCAKNCDVGKQIKSLGDLLTIKKNRKKAEPLLKQKSKPIVKTEKIKFLAPEKLANKTVTTKIEKEVVEVTANELSKEKYLELKSQGLTDRQIMQKCKDDGMNMYMNKLHKLKADWDLVGELKHTKKAVEEKKPAVKVNEKHVQDMQELKQALAVTKQDEIKPEIKPCECQTLKQKLQESQLNNHDKILSLQSEIALLKKRNEELVDSIAMLKRYRDMYLNTAQTLKVHLP